MSQIDSFDDKDPEEEDFFNIDFSDRLPPSDSIASIVTVFLAAGDASMLIDQFAFSGKVVSGRWRGGRLGTRYLVTARITSVQGRKQDKSGWVLVADT